MELVLAPHPILETVCTDPDLEGGKLSRAMVEWLRKHNKRVIKWNRNNPKLDPKPLGLGIAAPQLGISRRVCVMLLNDFVVSMINPRIVAHSKLMLPAVESCLSFPGEVGETFRYEWVKVDCDNWSASRTFGPEKPEDFSAASFLRSVCVQHEIAHLSGLTFHHFSAREYPEPNEWDAWRERLTADRVADIETTMCA
jgi:peptide deformylase